MNIREFFANALREYPPQLFFSHRSNIRILRYYSYICIVIVMDALIIVFILILVIAMLFYDEQDLRHRL